MSEDIKDIYLGLFRHEIAQQVTVINCIYSMYGVQDNNLDKIKVYLDNIPTYNKSNFNYPIEKIKNNTIKLRSKLKFNLDTLLNYNEIMDPEDNELVNDAVYELKNRLYALKNCYIEQAKMGNKDFYKLDYSQSKSLSAVHP